MTFSEKIKQLRIDKNLTQEQASKEMEIAVSSLRNYESGRFPDTYQLKKIKQFYDVPYEYLLEDNCENITKDTVDIGKKLKLSDKAIKKIEEINSYGNSEELNYYIENMPYYSMDDIKNIKKLQTIKIEYIDFFITLFAIEKYIEKNEGNKKLIDDITSLYRNKIEELTNLDIVKSDENSMKIPIMNDIRTLELNVKHMIKLIKTNEAKTNDYIDYVDKVIGISKKFHTYLCYHKFSISNSLARMADKIAPEIEDVYNVYYKELDKYYEQISEEDGDYGFGKNIIEKARKKLKQAGCNYIDITKLR